MAAGWMVLSLSNNTMEGPRPSCHTYGWLRFVPDKGRDKVSQIGRVRAAPEIAEGRFGCLVR